MSASSAQLEFAAEFVLFLAAASGLAVGALRGELLSSRPRGRVSLAAGFAALATAAFLDGSRLVDDGAAVVAGLRAAGVFGVLAGLQSGWAAGRTARGVLGAGVVLVAGGAIADVAGAETVASVALAGGGVAVATALT
ncbi:MAG: hypothetical protein M3Q48_06320, partial [Actinomycetota bacterium]|nr:hypothetical protein [Actinomycetota bacterium]